MVNKNGVIAGNSNNVFMKFNSEDLYEHVGYLFYGIACEDTRLSAGNLLRLNQFIDSMWRLTICDDVSLSKHLADCIHGGVRFASVNNMSVNQALASFTGYFIMHPSIFGQKLRAGILLSVEILLKEFPNNLRAGDINKDVQRLLAAHVSV
jgi:hypothetical protein